MCTCCGKQCREYQWNRCGRGKSQEAEAKAPTDYRTLVPTEEVPNPYCLKDDVHKDAWIFQDSICRQVCLPFRYTNAARKRGLRYEGHCWEKGCSTWKGLGKQSGVTFHEFTCTADALNADAAPRSRAARDVGAPLAGRALLPILGGGLAVCALVGLAFASMRHGPDESPAAK